MKRTHVFRALGALALLGSGAATACDGGDAERPAPASPYADQLSSPIRGLSAKEIGDLREGRGMGLARAAELNGYPGPRHVLDLRAELRLDEHSASSIQALFQRMQAQARELGAALLDGEAQLDRMFRDETITADELARRSASLAALYGQLRAVHLSAHLETKALLSSEQVARYDELRGYGAAGAPHQH
jgi:hypothetical protein